MTTRKKRLIAGIGAAVVIVVGAIIVYFAFIKSDAPPPLTLDSVATTTTAASSGASGAAAPTTTAVAATGATGAATTTPASGAASASNVDGTWKITNASQVGYRRQAVSTVLQRVDEDLEGLRVDETAVEQFRAHPGAHAVGQDGVLGQLDVDVDGRRRCAQGFVVHIR